MNWSFNEHCPHAHKSNWSVRFSIFNFKILPHCDGTIKRQLHSFPNNRICKNVIMILMDVRPQNNCMTKCNCNCNRNILNYLVNFRFSWFVATVVWLHSDFNRLSVTTRGWMVVSSSIVTLLMYWKYFEGFNCSFSRGMKLFPMLHCRCF